MHVGCSCVSFQWHLTTNHTISDTHRVPVAAPYFMVWIFRRRYNCCCTNLSRRKKRTTTWGYPILNAYTHFVLSRSFIQYLTASRAGPTNLEESFHAQHPSRPKQPRTFTSDTMQALVTPQRSGSGQGSGSGRVVPINLDKKQTGCTHWVPPQIWAYGNSLNVSHRTSIGQMKKIPFVYDLRTVGISGQTLPILNDLMCHTSDNGQMGPPFLFTIYSVVLYLRAVVVHSSGQIDHRSLIFSYYDLHSTCCSMFFRKGSFYCEALARNFTAWGL